MRLPKSFQKTLGRLQPMGLVDSSCLLSLSQSQYK